MDKPVLKDSMKLLTTLGKVKSRSMFGGFGIFIDDTMFALVVNDQLHLRADDKSVKQFKSLGLEPYVYAKRGFPVITKYFALPNEYWEDTTHILSLAASALDLAKKDKAAQEAKAPDRIKDLPNMRLATERMLKKAGIAEVEQLKNAGAVEAFKAIKLAHPDLHPNLELLWALEGAISGTHWSVVSIQRRDELARLL